MGKNIRVKIDVDAEFLIQLIRKLKAEFKIYDFSEEFAETFAQKVIDRIENGDIHIIASELK